MQKKTKKQLSSTGKDKATTSQNRAKKPACLSYSIYRSTLKLPLRIFVECADTGDLTGLIIKGKPTDDQLATAWLQIRQENAEQVAGLQGRRYLDLQLEISRLIGKLRVIRSVATILCDIDVDDQDFLELNEGFAKIINRLSGTKYKFDDKQERIHEIESCLVRSGAIKAQLEIKEAQLEALDKKNKSEGPQKFSPEDYYETLIELSDHSKVALNDSITLFEYNRRVARLNKYIKNLNKK